MRTTFYLIRHAHADWSPDEQRPLSERGRAEALRLAEQFSQFPITRICSSPYLRARQTIEPLAVRLGLPVEIEPDLKERELGQIPPGLDFFTAVQKTWKDPSFTHPRGESNAAAQFRGVALLQRLMLHHPGDRWVLSTHGNLLALVLKHFDPNVDYDFWKTMMMPDAYELHLEKDQGRIIRLLKLNL